MPSLRFAPYREIASDVASRLLSRRNDRDPLAPWDEEVIVPSRGAAEAIAAELLRRMPGGIAGLQLQSLDTLARRVLSTNGQTPRIAGDAERRLAMRMAVRTIDDGMMSSRGIASMLERSYRDVRDSGFTLAQFIRRVESTRGLRNLRRTELVIRAWTEYERRIAQLHAIDPADLFQRATRLIDARVKPQLLAGFYDMTGAQWRVAEALLRAERVAEVWVPSEAPFARAFVELVTPFMSTVILSRPSAAHSAGSDIGEGPPADSTSSAPNRGVLHRASPVQDDSFMRSVSRGTLGRAGLRGTCMAPHPPGTHRSALPGFDPAADEVGVFRNRHHVEVLFGEAIRNARVVKVRSEIGESIPDLRCAVHAPQSDRFNEPVANRPDHGSRLVVVTLDVDSRQVGDRFSELVLVLLENQASFLAQSGRAE
jgi:hypothetical protein